MNTDTLSRQDDVVAFLGRVQRRLRLSRAVHELAAATCWPCGAWCGLRALATTNIASAVIDGLTPLVIIACTIAAIVHAARVRGAPDLSRVAGIVDRRAGLADELKTAYGLLRQTCLSAIERRQIERARITARTLDPARIIPVPFPRPAGVAAALLLVGIAMPSVSIHWDRPTVENGAMVTKPGTRHQPAPAQLARQREREREPLERTTQTPDDVEYRGAVADAIEARDAARLAELLGSMQTGLTIGDSGAALRRPQSGSAAAHSSVSDSRHAERADDTGRPSPVAVIKTERAEQARTVAIAQSLAEQMQEEWQGDASAVPRQSPGGDPSTAADLPGRFDAKRRDDRAAGSSGETHGMLGPAASEGDRATRNASGAADDALGRWSAESRDEPLLGQLTPRLRMALQRTPIDGSRGAETVPGRDVVFAATPSQSSRLAYSAAADAVRYTAEAFVQREQVPAAYREAVKRYLLQLNAKDR